MAKPIVIIYLPENFVIAGGKQNAPMLLMEALNGSFGDKKEASDKIIYNDYWKDYYWFSFYDYEIETPRFEVFYDKDFTEASFEELKQTVLDAIEKQNSQSIKQ